MNLKFVTNTQVIEVLYEGRTRQFAVTSIYPTKTDSRADHLVDDLNTLSLDSESRREVWTVGWNTVLRITEAERDAPPGAGQNTTHKVRVREFSFTVKLYLMAPPARGRRSPTDRA